MTLLIYRACVAVLFLVVSVSTYAAEPRHALSDASADMKNSPRKRTGSKSSSSRVSDENRRTSKERSRADSRSDGGKNSSHVLADAHGANNVAEAPQRFSEEYNEVVRQSAKQPKLALVLTDYDETKVEFPLNLVQYSKTLQHMIDDLGANRVDDRGNKIPIPIRNVSLTSFKHIKRSLAFIASEQETNKENLIIRKDTRSLIKFIRAHVKSVPQLNAMLVAADFLDIELLRNALVTLLAQIASHPDALEAISTRRGYEDNIVLSIIRNLTPELSAHVMRELIYYDEVMGWLFSLIGPPQTLKETDRDRNASITALCPIGCDLFTGDGQGRVVLWDLKTLAPKKIIKAHTARVTCISASPSGGSVHSTSYDSAIKTISPDGELETVGHHRQGGFALAVTGKEPVVISGGRSQYIKVWDLNTKQCKDSLTGHDTRHVTALCLSADEKLLGSGDNMGRVVIRSLENNEILQSFESHKGQINALCFDVTKTTIFVAADDKIIKEWDVATGSCLQCFDHQTANVRSLCIRPNGQDLCSGSLDATVRVWDIETGACCLKLSDHTKGINSVCVSKDGRFLYSGSSDGTAKIWDLEVMAKIEQQLLAHHVIFFKFLKDWIATNNKDKQKFDKEHLISLYNNLPPFFKPFIEHFVCLGSKLKGECQLL